MQCPETGRLEELARGELPADEAAELEAHLAACSSCTARSRQLKRNERLISELRAYHREHGLPEPTTRGIPERIGQYRILSEIGRGGMGVVYRAEQERPHREVALKVIHPRLTSARSMRRFELEVEILGRLEHPGIARIFEAGTAEVWSAPQPFFAMEYVRGRKLVDYCDEEGLDVARRLTLFTDVCEAVHYAHLRGVIHRDLKPGNVLVDEQGHAVVIDFGLARASDPDLAGVSAHTEVGNVLGTLPYMAPEQVDADLEAVDARADVYALGAVLFQLLCGRAPLVLEGMPLARAVVRISEEEPPAPSSVRSSVPRELDWIALKALEKEPDRRYQSVAELASDVRRFRRHEPLVARPPSRAYRLSLFLRRHRVGAAVSAVALLALVAALIQARDSAEAARRARDGNSLVAGIAIDAVEALNVDDPLDRRSELTQLGERLLATDAAPLERARLLVVTAKNLGTLGAHERAFDLLEAALEITSRRRGTDHPDTAEVQHEMGRLVISQNRLDEAEELLTRALDVRVRHLGADSQEVQRTRIALGAAYYRMGRYDRAERTWSEAKAVLARTDGAAEEVLMLEGNLGSLYRTQGLLAKAERTLRRVLDERERALGEDHHHTLNALMSLAVLYRDMDQLERSLALLATATARIVERYGESHHETFRYQQALASTQIELDRFAEAEELLERVLRGRSRLLGPEHPDTLGTLNNLGVLYQRLARYDEAEERLTSALELKTQALPPCHPSALNSMENLGLLYFERGRYDVAEPLLVGAYRARRETLGARHRETLGSTRTLVRLYTEQGRFAEARTLLEGALAAAREVMGEEHSDTVDLEEARGALLRMTGELEAAEWALRAAVAFAVRTFGDDHLTTLDYTHDLAELLLERGQLAEAERRCRSVLAFRRCRFGERHPDALDSRNLLARILAQGGAPAAAARLFEEVLESACALFGDEHPTTLAALTGLAALRAEEGRYSDAHALARRAFSSTDRRHGALAQRRALLDSIVAQQARER